MQSSGCVRVAFLLFSVMAVGGPSAGAQAVTLTDVLRRAAETNPEVRALVWRQRESEARIRELRHRDGWEAYLEAEQEIDSGDRWERRDTSTGRDPRSVKDHLREVNWSVDAGLKRTFLGPAEDRAADIALERLAQLDQQKDILQAQQDAAFTAAEAYLDTVGGVRLATLIHEQIAHASDMVRILRARHQQGETLRLDLLEAEYNLAQLQQRARRNDNRLGRQIRFLRRLLGRDDLVPHDLAPADVPGASEIARWSVDELIDYALARRRDLQAARAALQAATTFVEQHARVLPDVDFRIGVGYHEGDRDWSDERRDDELFELQYGVEISVPLSIQPRNRARRQRFSAVAEARALKLAERHQRVAHSIRKAHEAYLMAVAERDVVDRRIAHAEEELRVIQLVAERLPEQLTQSPEIAVYRVQAKLLEARTDRQRAEFEALNALLVLAAETHLLFDALPATPADVAAEDGS